ncbi:translation elongation factor Ts [Anaerobiospirillum sp. NML120448]|uniref:translation elongation factor Ts n=1 Tax=Anaerobiospirillum sp. NML120448 TaxID=2932816 RepID=UPI001FF1DA6C|nr:translation elongation factor Ts [Anaerobiospirillum sp. NML120448]MCK0513447.1 translation elongation factor Ts [Anaerobiospirillum sp. NML120448]
MANVTAALVKELRDITGAGMMDCKKALVATDGNIEAAIEEMRKSGALKAAKKATRTAAEGIIATAHEGNEVVLVEVNSETDFAAKNAEFVEFANKVAQIALAAKTDDVEALKAVKYDDNQTVGEALTALVAKIGENLGIRRIFRVSGDNLGIYVHSNKRIGVVAVLEGGDEETAKHVAMHICASKPDFVNPEDVSAEVVEKERQIQIEIAVNSGKPKEIAEKMVEGRMKKFTGEVSLTGQPFVMDPSISVGEMLKQHGATAKSFIRVEVGEGIEKKNDDFAAEVQAQIAAASNK